MWTELRQSIRSLTASPGFAAASITTLALGIGASTVVFSFVNALLLRPLPFGEATPRIVSLHATHPTQFPDDWDDAEISYADLFDVASECASIDAVAAVLDRSFTLYGEETVRVAGASITPGLFEMLGQKPAIGRSFRPEEGERIGFATAVILSDGLWRTRYGADPSILGRTILLNERELTVVGVMPERFRYPERADLWVPYDPGEDTNRAARNLLGVARLAPGRTLTDARLEVEGAAERLAARYPDTNRGWGVYVLPYRALIVNDAMRLTASSLLGAVGIVLLIGCANLTSLMLARGIERQREHALRAAMGASRSRLAWGVLVESLTLGVAGGLLGALVASWGLDAVVASFPEELPYWLSFDADWRIGAFVVLVSLAASLAVGWIPAMRTTRFQLTATLGSGRDARAGQRASRLQGGLIVGQVALSLALLVGAALMHRSFTNLTSADPGFDGGPVLTLKVYLAGDGYDPVPTRSTFFRDAAEALRAVPGVASAVATTSVPTDDGGAAARLVTRENPAVDGSELGVQVIASTEGLFETLGVELLEGRALEPRDFDEGAGGVAVVGRTLAERLWPGQPASGREIGIVGSTGVRWARVIGVASHLQYEEFGEETPQSELNVFVPYPVLPARGMAFLVRAETSAGALARPIRDELRRFAPGLPVFLVRTMDEVRRMTTWEQRLFSRMFDGFALAAILLACLGLYGLVAYRMTRRERELGVRIALGARASDLLLLLARQGLWLAGAGIAVGLLLALGVGRVLEGALYGVRGDDWTLAAVAAAVLIVPIAAASFLPARRAARLDPTEALKRD